jgi:ribonuclease HII
MKILGIDEAGKNPLVGPMVVAGFVCEESRGEELRQLGVRDSKAFGSGAKARQKRRQLAEQLRTLGQPVIRRVSAAEINHAKLNRLVHEAGKKILGQVSAQAVFTDGGEYFEKLAAYHPQLTTIVGGDKLNVFVSAASILAKDQRDRCYEQILAAQRDDIEGLLADEEDAYERLLNSSGYPSSKLVKKFKPDGVMLKDGSPSCGIKNIHDGTFKGVKRPGIGVLTCLLGRAGFFKAG